MSRDASPQDFSEIAVRPENRPPSIEDRSAESTRAVSRPVPPDERVDEGSSYSRPEAVLSDPRKAYRNRFSDTVVRTLAELGRFRVIATHDLGLYVYGGRTDEASAALRDLVRRDLVRKGTFEGPEASPRELLTLTEQGHELVRALVPEDQEIHHGFTKPREANHDADLYLLYQKETARIEKAGGRTLRVILDYELKRKVNRDLTHFGMDARPEIARRHGLRVVGGKIPIPDLRIEYETGEGERASVNLELVTENYRGPTLAEKVRAGFSLYAPQSARAHLRRVLDHQAPDAEIFSL
jgi:DNA-binding MarR family transcriptional regulator